MPSNHGSRQRKALAEWALEQLTDGPQLILGSATLEEIESNSILWGLVCERGSIPNAAVRLDTSVRTIQKRVKDWGFVYVKT